MLMSDAGMWRLEFLDSWGCIRTVKEVTIVAIHRASETGQILPVTCLRVSYRSGYRRRSGMFVLSRSF